MPKSVCKQKFNFIHLFRASEYSASSNNHSSQNKAASPRKVAGKENATPRSRPPVTRKMPAQKAKRTPNKSKAGSSRNAPKDSSSEEDEQPPPRPKATRAHVAHKKTARAPTPEPESESEVSSPEPEPQNRSGRSRDRQPRDTSAPTPRPKGRAPNVKAVPIVRPVVQPARIPAPAPVARQVGKPVGASKRKQQIPVFREMQRLQMTTNCQIPRAPFSRVVRETMQRVERRGAEFRITPEALEALRESSESFLTQVFSDSYLITLNRKQVTLAPKDIQLLMFLRGPTSGFRA